METNVMRLTIIQKHFLITTIVIAFYTIPTSAADLGSNAEPYLNNDSNLNNKAFYGSVKFFRTNQKAKNMDLSTRPSIGTFISGDDIDNFYNSSIALGYDYGNGWRIEGEYTFNHKSLYTASSSNFPTSFNFHQTKAQRIMFNAYHDFNLTQRFSAYGTLGLGMASIKSGGWQGNTSRQYADNTENNIAYSVGAGLSYAMTKQLNFDLGYRYVDMGNIQSGFNQFTNVRGLQDEQLKARLVSNEFILGVRYKF